MKTNIKIDAVKKEITMTKATAKKARFCGTTENKHLAQAMKDFPDFEVKILSPQTRGNEYKGLSVKLMEELIEVMADNSEDALEKLWKEQAKYHRTKGYYVKLKDYFLAEYPNWKEYLYEVEKRQTEVQKQEKPEEQKLRIEKVEPDEKYRKMGFDTQYNIL